MTFYVSADSSHIQDVTILNALACVPNSARFNDTFTLSTSAITAGAFSASESHPGVVTVGVATWPATYSFSFNGTSHTDNYTLFLHDALPIWETVTYNDGTAQ